MSFIDRVKGILLEKTENEIETINVKIQEVEELYSIESTQARKLGEESKAFSKERGQVQKKIINPKELKDLENIYEFVANYSQIEEITNAITHTSQMARYIINYGLYSEDPEILWQEEVLYRERLCSLMGNLNSQIEEIIEGKKDVHPEGAQEKENQKNILEEREENGKNISENIQKEDVKKIGFFARLFGRKRKSLPEPDKTIEVAKPKKIFNDYRRTIRDFEDNFNSFLEVNLEGPTIIDRRISALIITNVNGLTGAKKRGIELEEADENYLDFMQPLDLWREIAKYYVGTTEITKIIQNFGRNFDRFETLYQEKPELFDVENLRKIFAENDQQVLDLRAKTKVASSKSSEFAKKKQEEREIKAQLKVLEDKLKSLKEKKKKISSAKTLSDLGYKSKEDAARKLSIDTKDYIIIPIPKNVQSLSELFKEEKGLKIEIDGMSFSAVYSNDIATGKINTLEDVKDIDVLLLVPISELEKEDIDNIRSGKIGLNPSVLQREKLFVMIQGGREFDLEGNKIEKRRFAAGSIDKNLREFLGEDYVKSQDETSHYSIFKGVANVSSKEKRLKKEAVKKCVLESLRREVSSKEAIIVNGKALFLNRDDEVDMLQRGRTQPLNEEKISKIVDEMENYCLEGKAHPGMVDLFYKKLLMEYMRVNPKAKADYYEEENSTVKIGEKQISIKPILPAKDETIAKRYSRPSEDITYKTMKLAALVNRFAHLTENQKLQDALFDLKLWFIEAAIDQSENNPKINLKRNFDEKKMVMSVSLEIPGYNMIALHTKNKGKSLSYKANRLEEQQGEILQSSTILIPGVNKELLLTMKNMNEEERARFLVDMDPAVFYKLALRMGYTQDKVSSESDKKKFIKDMTSDKKLEEMIKDTKDLEK